MTAGRPFWSVPTVADETWSPLNSGGYVAASIVWPLGHLRRPERDEVEAAGLADEPADGLGVGDARQLDDDAVGALGRDDGLGDAGRVDPALDDVLDDRHVAGGRLLALDGDRLVLDAETARQVEAELRLDRPPGAVGTVGVGQLEARPEVDRQGEDADDEDEDRAGSTHRGGMLHGTGCHRAEGDRI